MSSSIGAEMLLELSASFLFGVFAIFATKRSFRNRGPLGRVFMLELLIFVPPSRASC